MKICLVKERVCTIKFEHTTFMKKANNTLLHKFEISSKKRIMNTNINYLSIFTITKGLSHLDIAKKQSP